MAPSASANGPSGTPNEDFVTKHGKRIVVIIFCILIGDTIPVIIQNGLDPDERFYTIVFVALPYTGALVLILLLLFKSKGPSYEKFALSAVILFVGFALGAHFHWGIGDAEAAQVFQQLEDLTYVPTGAPKKNPIEVATIYLSTLLHFYIIKYDWPLFIAATLAAPVITWNIFKWVEKPASRNSPERPTGG